MLIAFFALGRQSERKVMPGDAADVESETSTSGAVDSSRSWARPWPGSERKGITRVAKNMVGVVG